MKINIKMHVTGEMLDDPMVAARILGDVAARLKLKRESIEVGQKFDLRDPSGNIVGEYSVTSEYQPEVNEQFMSAQELRDKYRRTTHPQYPIEHWQDDVTEGRTKLGYWDWVVDMIDDGE